ncbi:tyrosine-type recombinase/integrase [Streptomyces tricolor]|nr:tyrosine-type recombinase/integrase [Streptomyces tricolor]
MAHLPGWGDKLTPHVLRHFCASELYLGGLDLIAIQEVLGHSWIATFHAIRPRPADPGRGRLGGRAAAGREAAGRTPAMKWNCG